MLWFIPIKKDSAFSRIFVIPFGVLTSLPGTIEIQHLLFNAAFDCCQPLRIQALNLSQTCLSEITWFDVCSVSENKNFHYFSDKSNLDLVQEIVWVTDHKHK